MTGVIASTTIVLSLRDQMALVLNGERVLDVPALLTRMKADPFAIEFFWLHLTWLSTLIWTLMHLFAAGFAAGVTLVYQTPLRQIALDSWEGAYKNNDRNKQRTLAWFFTLRNSIGFIVVFLLGYGLFSLFTKAGLLKPAVIGLVQHIIIPLSQWAQNLPVLFVIERVL